MLAANLTSLHAGLRAALITHVAGPSALAASDALLLLADEHHGTKHQGTDAWPGAAAIEPARRLHSTTTLYIATHTDPSIWDRATALRANEVLFTPYDDHELGHRLARHLDAPARPARQSQPAPTVVTNPTRGEQP